MILEVAILDVKPGQHEDFESAFSKARKIISSMPGHIDHQLQKCLEKENRYILLVTWEKLEDHTEGFRKSPEYQDWKALLHHFYDPFPEVEHYTLVEH
ncbi:antibiotic biosynthesis monooxygenase family protein [Microbulbifer hydrolyticus]|uniref:Antibiotic biosynthesis monooxygenase n=1 Tax=Microbulbifer hydrolyticus TaxID=48074 RepID=A0A6P1TEI7_9GAMM|nr:antibiotic biosynthesis monooxygenase [Microbulbifer hydrolyticus]MBB5212420.1 heme-degrading monooxygenase HmoA [Microbulbifer hydrolyticus]QHQ40053.1 antibiotic biosynthesis monooxygenase [Microbulbifer hydrolyticus]